MLLASRALFVEEAFASLGFFSSLRSPASQLLVIDCDSFLYKKRLRVANFMRLATLPAEDDGGGYFGHLAWERIHDGSCFLDELFDNGINYD